MVFGSRPGSSLVLHVLRGALLAGSYCPLPPSLFLRSRLLNCHFLARCSPEPEAQPHLDSLPSLPRNPVLFFESQAAIQLLEWRAMVMEWLITRLDTPFGRPTLNRAPYAAQTQPELAIHDLPFCKFRLAVEEGSEVVTDLRTVTVPRLPVALQTASEF